MNLKDESITLKKFSKEIILKYIDDLLQIEEEAFAPFSPPYDKWDLNNFIFNLPDKDRLSFLMYDTKKNKIIGFLIGSSYDNATHLNRIAVLEEYQGKSLGKLLLEKFLEKSKEYGFKKTTLSTIYDPSHNYVIKFYEKMNYKILTKKEDIINFLIKKNKMNDLESFYPTNKEGKFIIMEKEL